MFRLHHALAALALLGFAPGALFAGTVLYQGTFISDSEFAQFEFELATESDLSIRSWGYAGGIVPTSPSSTTISSGGFATNLLLFDNVGDLIRSDNGGVCKTTGEDPVTGNCSDGLIEATLVAGRYTLVLAEWNNTSVDGTLSGWLTQVDSPGFTCAQFGLSGNFCDLTTALGDTRTGDWAVSFSGDGLLTDTPEPSTALMVILPALGLGLVSRRRKR